MSSGRRSRKNRRTGSKNGRNSEQRRRTGGSRAASGTGRKQTRRNVSADNAQRRTASSTRRTGTERRRRRRRSRVNRKPFIISVMILILIAAITIGIILFLKYRVYTGYTVTSTIDMGNSEDHTEYYEYGNGYLKCASDGVAYFNEDGVVWDESYTMIQPIIDICDNYIAVADMSQRNIYVYDKGGSVSEISLNHNITDLEISQAGVIAAVTNDEEVSYLEIMDKNGSEILTQKSVFSSQGYLMDIALSDEGTKLAAVFVSVSQGTLKSKVVFYDISGSEPVTNTFDQYESDLLTTIHYMDDDTFCAVGDTGMSIYRFKEEPVLVYEDLEWDWEIQSLFINNLYIGMIVEEPESETTYTVKVFDETGNIQLDIGTDFSFTHVAFAGDNVNLYSNAECEMYSLAGIRKFAYRFDDRIEALISKDGRDFVCGTSAETKFIRLN